MLQTVAAYGNMSGCSLFRCPVVVSAVAGNVQGHAACCRNRACAKADMGVESCHEHCRIGSSPITGGLGARLRVLG